MAKRWDNFPAMEQWLVSIAAGLSETVGDHATQLFVKQGPDGVKSLCRSLGGTVLYLPMLVTPELAVMFRSMQTERQRHANDPTVDSYKRDMDSGNWLETGDGFRFDTLGQLVDGGHRATSIIRSSATIRTLVVFGVKPEAALVIDSGRGRTAANTLGFFGAKNSQELAGVIPRLISAEQGRWVSPSRYLKASREEIISYLQQHPELPDLVTEATRRTSGTVRIPRATKTAVGVALAVLYRTPVHLHSEVHDFFEKLTTGAAMTDGSSVLVLQRTLSKGAPPQWRRASRSQEPGGFTIDETLALFFAAWNRRHETNVKKLHLDLPLSDENFPRPKQVKMASDS